MTFGAYLRMLRKSRGMTLKYVERKAGVSNAYLSQIERGLRNPPHAEILKRIAKVYDVPQEDLLHRAGYLELPTETSEAKKQVERAFQHVTSDPHYKHGTRLRHPNLSLEAKRFIVEMYEKMTGRKLLEGS